MPYRSRFIELSITSVAKLNCQAQTGLKAVTGVASVARVFARPSNLPALEASLAALGARFPGAHLFRYLDKVPTVADDSTVFPTATLVGDVRIDAGVSIWFGG